MRKRAWLPRQGAPLRFLPPEHDAAGGHGREQGPRPLRRGSAGGDCGGSCHRTGPKAHRDRGLERLKPRRQGAGTVGRAGSPTVSLSPAMSASLLRKTARKSMKRFPVGAPTTQRLISFIQREEEAPRQTASSTQVVSIRLCPRGTGASPLEPPHKRKALMCDSRSLKTLKQRVQALPLLYIQGASLMLCDSGPNSRREFRVHGGGDCYSPIERQTA